MHICGNVVDISKDVLVLEEAGKKTHMEQQSLT